MLSNQHFYHRIIRKMVIAFGTMFNNVRLVRYDKAGTTEIERITVPLMYADKEKFYKRITQDPELTKEVDITLPRMGFSMNGVTYDPLRKTSIFNTEFGTNPVTGGVRSTRRVPYNFDFTLSIYVRNTEDGTQIIEQILPYFNPDYTLTIDIAGVPELKSDVPLILNSVNQNMQADGVPDQTRVITWDLNFTLKGYLYGPVTDSKIIKTVSANTFLYNTSSTIKKELILTSGGSGDFKIGEMVYEGVDATRANATGFVDSWNSISNKLILIDNNGIIKIGSTIRGAVTGAAWVVESVASADYQLVSTTVQPNPTTAEATDDFGYTETTIEYI